MTFDRETCDHCGHAQLAPHWPLYKAQCKGCAVRGLAESPAFHESSKAGRMTETYRDALGVIFGDDWQAGHVRVKAEAIRIKALRQAR